MKQYKFLMLIILLVGFSKISTAQSLSKISINETDSKSSVLTNMTLKSIATENIFEFIDTTKTSTKKVVLIVFTAFIVGAILGGWGIFQYSKHKIYSILKEERVYYLDYTPLKSEKSVFNYITLFHVLKRRKDSYKKYNSEIKKELNEMELENLN